METKGLWSPVVLCSGSTCLEQPSSPHLTQQLPPAVQNFSSNLPPHFRHSSSLQQFRISLQTFLPTSDTVAPSNSSKLHFKPSSPHQTTAVLPPSTKLLLKPFSSLLPSPGCLNPHTGNLSVKGRGVKEFGEIGRERGRGKIK